MSEGPHPHGYLGRQGPRTAPALLGQLRRVSRAASLACCVGAAIALPGCDLAPAPPDAGDRPPLHVLATFPENGAGTECEPDAPDDCGVPRNTPLEFRFDRFLLPKTATRQSLRVYSGDPANGVFLEPEYDAVERVVTYRLQSGALLERGVVYHVEPFFPDEDDGAGFRAFDGAALVRGPVPVRFSFRTAKTAAPTPSSEPPPTCDVAVTIFTSACVRCHGGPSAFMGLDLGSAEGLEKTAVSRVARETEGPRAGKALVDPARFGVGMPLIDPGSPAGSYLFYKLLLNPENFGTACDTAHSVALPAGVCPLATDSERARLGDWFVRLDPMPPDHSGLDNGLEDLRTLADYIRAGAETASCTP